MLLVPFLGRMRPGRRPRRRRLAALLAASVVGVGGVSLWTLTRSEAPVATALMTDPPEWTVWTEPREALVGRLEVSDEGCVVIRRSEGDVLLLTERGSKLIDGGREVEVAHVGTFVLGEVIDHRGDINTSWRGGSDSRRRSGSSAWDRVLEPWRRRPWRARASGSAIRMCRGECVLSPPVGAASKHPDLPVCACGGN